MEAKSLVSHINNKFLKSFSGPICVSFSFELSFWLFTYMFWSLFFNFEAFLGCLVILGYSFIFQIKIQDILVWKLLVCWLGLTGGIHHWLWGWTWFERLQIANMCTSCFLGRSVFLERNFLISCLEDRASLLLLKESLEEWAGAFTTDYVDFNPPVFSMCLILLSAVIFPQYSMGTFLVFCQGWGC